MHTSILPRLACPECQKGLSLGSKEGLPVAEGLSWEGTLSCLGCRTTYPITSGIARLVRPARRQAVAEFAEAYERLRVREGWAIDLEAYYRGLPFQDLSGRHVKEWKIRAFSFGRLLERVTRFAAGRRLRVVDLGAGSGWLAARLAEAGHQALAVDLDPGPHGLLAARHLRSDGPDFACLQGEISEPPLALEGADLIILNAALHYVPEHRKVFQRLRRALVPGGALAILDSPTYPTAEERDRAARASERYYLSQGEPSLAEHYRGLLREELREALEGFHKFEAEITHAPPPLRALAGKLLRGYRPARFELVWVQRP